MNILIGPSDITLGIIKAFGIDPEDLTYFKLEIPLKDVVSITTKHRVPIEDVDTEKITEVCRKFILTDVTDRGEGALGGR